MYRDSFRTIALAVLTVLVVPASSAYLATQDGKVVIPRKQSKPPGPPLSPADALAKMQVPEGFHVELVASEPDLLNPVAMAFDDRGRIWVTESFEYPRHEPGPGRDRIKILEDTTGDGKIDSVKIFAEGLNIPSGIAVGHGGVWVANAPDILFMQDTDGDDKADKKETLFSGIAGTQHDHGIHAFTFGPDGKLYFNFGNSGREIKDKNGTPIVDTAGNTVVANRKPYQEGMVFRCNLDGSEFETLGWNFRNNWMVTVDSFGSLWQSDNDDDGNKGVRINYVMEFGNYGYKDERTGAGWKTARTGMEKTIPERHWHLNDPGVVPNLLQTGAGSPTGITVYEGDLLPMFKGHLLHCDAGPNVCRAYITSNDGAGYKAKIRDVLTGVQDKWFRPSDVKVAPDGSLIVADWYDPGVGGHGMGDLDRGRLFRIVPFSHKGVYKVPKFDYSAVDGAIEALKNPNYAVRYMAWQSLHAMGAKAETALQKLADSDNPIYQARAIWLLGKIEDRGIQTVKEAITDKNSNIRIVGIRLARQLKLGAADYVSRMIDDESPQVRRELLIALRHSKSPQQPGLWAKLAAKHDGKDRWYLEALGIASDLNPDFCFAAWLELVGDKWNTPAGRDIVWRTRAQDAADYMVKILQDSKTPEKEHDRYMRSFDFHDGAKKEAALKSLLGL